MRGHAARLVHRLRPGVVQHFAATHRLGQEYFVSEIFFMLVNTFQHGSSGGSHGCLQGGFEVFLLYKTHSSEKPFCGTKRIPYEASCYCASRQALLMPRNLRLDLSRRGTAHGVAGVQRSVQA